MFQPAPKLRALVAPVGWPIAGERRRRPLGVRRIANTVPSGPHNQNQRRFQWSSGASSEPTQRPGGHHAEPIPPVQRRPCQSR